MQLELSLIFFSYVCVCVRAHAPCFLVSEKVLAICWACQENAHPTGDLKTAR